MLPLKFGRYWVPRLKQPTDWASADAVNPDADPESNLHWLKGPRASWLHEHHAYFRVQCYFRVYPDEKPPRLKCVEVRAARAMSPAEIHRAYGMDGDRQIRNAPAGPPCTAGGSRTAPAKWVRSATVQERRLARTAVAPDVAIRRSAWSRVAGSSRVRVAGHRSPSTVQDLHGVRFRGLCSDG